jgi:AraC-like DNA-binding protein
MRLAAALSFRLGFGPASRALKRKPRPPRMPSRPRLAVTPSTPSLSANPPGEGRAAPFQQPQAWPARVRACRRASAARSDLLACICQKANRSCQNFMAGAATVVEETSQRGLPTTTGFAAREAIAMLRKHNIATAPLLLRAGLSEHGLARAADEANGLPLRVPAIGQCKFLEYAAEAMDDSAFGLHLAGRIDPRDVGMYFYAGSAARDVGESLALFSRYCRIVNEAFRLTQRSADSAIVLEYVGLPRYAARHNMEYVVAGIAVALRTMSGRNVVPAKVAFAHSRNSDVREFERFFGCPVEFGAPSTVFQISADDLRLPLITADPKLLRVLRPYCDAAAKERNVKRGTLRSVVEAEVEKLLPHGKAKAENVADALALSLRTLARRLADEGTTYGDVVDQLRKSLATQYLKDPGMSLGQIAWLLGYEGSTSFNHAFKRWTGRSPSADRHRGRPHIPE